MVDGAETVVWPDGGAIDLVLGLITFASAQSVDFVGKVDVIAVDLVRADTDDWAW